MKWIDRDRNVAVATSALHTEGPGFKPQLNHIQYIILLTDVSLDKNICNFFLKCAAVNLIINIKLKHNVFTEMKSLFWRSIVSVWKWPCSVLRVVRVWTAVWYLDSSVPPLLWCSCYRTNTMLWTRRSATWTGDHYWSEPLSLWPPSPSPSVAPSPFSVQTHTQT